MKLSTRSLYGMRALVELALASGRGPCSATHIATRQSLSVAYLEQLLHRLRKGGLLVSTRGPRGGYMLARAPHQITMAEVVRILDGEQNAWQEPEELGEWAFAGAAAGQEAAVARSARRAGKPPVRAGGHGSVPAAVRVGPGMEEDGHAQQITLAVRRCVHARLAEALGTVTLEDLCSEVRGEDDAPLDHRYVFHI